VSTNLIRKTYRIPARLRAHVPALGMGLYLFECSWEIPPRPEGPWMKIDLRHTPAELDRIEELRRIAGARSRNDIILAALTLATRSVIRPAGNPGRLSEPYSVSTVTR